MRYLSHALAAAVIPHPEVSRGVRGSQEAVRLAVLVGLATHTRHRQTTLKISLVAGIGR